MSLLHALQRGGWLRSVDSGLAATLSRLRPDTPDAVLSAAALASRAIANGHSVLPLGDVADLLAEIGSDREPPVLPELGSWLQLLRESPWVDCDATRSARPDSLLLLEGERLSLRRYWSYEQRLVAALRRRLKTPIVSQPAAVHEARVAALFGAAPVRDANQVAAALAALSQDFLLLTGGPGTGKTSTVARTLVMFAEAFAERGASSAASASGTSATGAIDAALHDSLCLDAVTVHRLLGAQHARTGFRHDAGNPLLADLVVVDEASMIDLPLMTKLLEAVPASATLVLIGDPDQLPSVETGDVLACLCKAASVGGHRVHLSHSHRQDDSLDVSLLAGEVRQGRGDAALLGLRDKQYRGVHWTTGGDRQVTDAVLELALPAYRALAQAPSVELALSLAREFRVLTAVRDGLAGSRALNAAIASALAPAREQGDFFQGRLLLMTQNSYRQQLFNGDIGVAWPDAEGELRIWFESADGIRSWLPAALPAHESAFAMTVHKAQGSEFGEVAFVLPERGARVISRELIYTGLTRCRRAVTLWATEGVLREGIARRAQRWSGLAERLGST